MPVQRLLIVEDDPLWREHLHETARSEGCEVALASDGFEALSYLNSQERARPNLVVMDLMMPRVDGWELYGRMRTTAALRDIPVLMMSVTGQSVNLGGVVGFLHKTDSPGPLLSELRQRLRGFDVFPPVPEPSGPYALRFTEETRLALGTLPPSQQVAIRQHLLRAAELANGALPMASTWLVALPGDPPALLVTVQGVRVVLEVDDTERSLLASSAIIPVHLPRS
ncbi:response regulator [Hyalangium versicolor]|uniref:response regulator n=1 Tax=Hyalangium versicolor TaxID=2861190 RepID=UPI001CCF997C|nr:response regulator [Hyalangium versicolor]